MDTQSKKTTYEDLIAESVLLAQQLPVGSCWNEGEYVHKVTGIHIGTGIATAQTIRITNMDRDKYRVADDYSYSIQSSDLFVSSIPNLTEITPDKFAEHEALVRSAFQKKNVELFEKQCLLKMPTDTPFSDFDTLNDEIVSMQGMQHFFYEPTENCFRVIRFHMEDYNGKDTNITENHFFMDHKEDKTFIMGRTKHGTTVQLGTIADRHEMYPITAFQYEHLVKFIGNDPNPNKHKIDG